ncbi:PAS domain-containing protein [Paracoccus shanxieyensis]|uniref:PAS domain-containing protein n=1 Tax=Paracoccus shanxieyensis TaxID=2675752 RepID=A0A6L6J1U9_9RHOB|nr:PAS domain-containing protein [Paracoccus shanxieyensis]MTH64667.1 PAS domain-containing protein [Paracoccus shanxieyensis]MTH87811.1 PAS domain-containing protein [Paracoccus shanxieyensis]
MTDFLLMAHGLDHAMRALQTHRAVLALDPVGRIAAINQCYLRLTGFSRDELLNRPVWSLLDLGERCAGRLNDLLSAPQGGEAHVPELAHLSKSGRRFRVDARVFAVRDEVGGACLCLIFARPEDAGSLIDMRDGFGRKAQVIDGSAFEVEAPPVQRRRFDH